MRLEKAEQVRATWLKMLAKASLLHKAGHKGHELTFSIGSSDHILLVPRERFLMEQTI